MSPSGGKKGKMKSKNKGKERKQTEEKRGRWYSPASTRQRESVEDAAHLLKRKDGTAERKRILPALGKQREQEDGTLASVPEWDPSSQHLKISNCVSSSSSPGTFHRAAPVLGPGWASLHTSPLGATSVCQSSRPPARDTLVLKASFVGGGSLRCQS